ncbi:TraK protein [Campylobacter hyointestinalis subsp. hyointestinalis]|uniref:TraK protein n=1 Tax=Campylobacter hyointestinalis subsp. hyointestinalis TaxID=91352 RepID=A0A0S4SVD5_CAMHY|nr:type-F conjugative transfer system secretin TraK [Campylobacter hyointestinalis]CUU89992.1 TraK protein [Campylobacter hyointestinalis subsp. hyointestinalis]
MKISVCLSIFSLVAILATNSIAKDNNIKNEVVTVKEIENQIIEYNDKTISLELSFDQTNRLVLPVNILSQVVSKEKNIEIAIDKNQAFIKFSPMKETVIANTADKNPTVLKNNSFYNLDTPIEVYFVTESKTYSFIFIPKEIKAQTVLINDKKKKLEEVFEKEKMLPFNTNITNIAKYIFTKGEIPGYEKVHLDNKLLAKNDSVAIYAINKHAGYKYDIFELKLVNLTNHGVSVEERNLIGLIDRSTYAVSIYYDNAVYEMAPHGSAKAILILASDKEK